MNFPIYCEQAYFSRVFEPLNTLSNLFFVFAGILILFKFHKKRQLDTKSVYFAVMLIIIGIGSWLWHYKRTKLNLILDSVPIGIFVLSFLFFYLKHITLKKSHHFLLFLGLSVYFYLENKIVLYFLPGNNFLSNDGREYLIQISYFFVLQIYNLYHDKIMIKPSIVSGSVFLLFIFFRKIDLYVCEIISFGTHYFWHAFHAVTFYLFVNILYNTKSL